MKITIFPGKYHQNCGFSMAMLVSGRVSPQHFCINFDSPKKKSGYIIEQPPWLVVASNITLPTKTAGSKIGKGPQPRLMTPAISLQNVVFQHLTPPINSQRTVRAGAHPSAKRPVKPPKGVSVAERKEARKIVEM